MKRIIRAMENKYLTSSLVLVEEVFTEYDSPEKGRVVRQLVLEYMSGLVDYSFYEALR